MLEKAGQELLEIAERDFAVFLAKIPPQPRERGTIGGNCSAVCTIRYTTLDRWAPFHGDARTRDAGRKDPSLRVLRHASCAFWNAGGQG
jgi:hypothetical protein